jgi:hypothetical protein
MGKKKQQVAAATGMPEFHIVVKRPSVSGPLGPYRFAICVAVAIFVTFDELTAMLGGVPADTDVLVRAILAGGFTWFVLTVLNKVLAHGVEPDESLTTSDSEP